jgi:hypothetical protein
MRWSEAAESLLSSLSRMVPETLRELASSAARDEAEGIAQESDASEVSADDVVRGWIRTTPPEQRNGLVEVIDQLGLDPERYADDLENAAGWDDEESEEPPDSGM